MRLAVHYIQNELHDYNDHAHTAIAMPISAFFSIGASGSLNVHHGVLYKQVTRDLASGSQSFGTIYALKAV
ncbi:MAG TPA: hypothetical protein DCX90_11870 [Ruminococcaceae bacterium]|nr:hypothetical protein [Oscillospiraceae bacterium]